MDNLEKALIGATLMNTIFHQYEAGELAKSGEKIRGRVAKFLRQRSNSNEKLLREVILKADEAWKKSINEYMTTAIEAKSTIAKIYDYFQKELEKFANIKEKDIELFTMQMTHDAEAEHNSRMVIDFLVQQLGIEKRVSAFSGKRLTIKNDMILEGIAIKDGF